jgi:hypothetical protein
MRTVLTALLVSAAFAGAVSACSSTINGTGVGAPSDGTDETGDSDSQSDGGSVGKTDGSPRNTTSGRTEYDALFDAPTNPELTDDSIFGLWAGSEYYNEDYDVRIRIKANSVLVATRRAGYGYGATALEVAAVVTKTSVKILATKSNGVVGFSPYNAPVCADATSTVCVEVSGETMSLGNGTFFLIDGRAANGQYMKLSD